MQLTNTKENADSQLIIDIPEGEYDLSTAAEASEQALNEQKNNELLEQNPTEYLIGLLSSLNDSGEGLTVDEKKIAKTIIKDAFAGKEFSMDSLLEMDAKEKSELVRNLTAIKPYMPSNVNEINYRSITEGLREGKDVRKLQLLGKDGRTFQTPRHEDLVTYFDRADTFHQNNITAMYKKLFLFGSNSEDKTPHIDSHYGDINGNSSISKEFNNVGREYFTYPEYLKENTKA